MRGFLDGLYRFSGGLAACFIVAITALVFLQVILNLIDRLAKLFTGTAIGLTVPSYSDFTGFFLAASAFLALAYTLRAGEHIRINLITSRLPANIQHIFELITVAIGLVLALFMTWHVGVMTYESWAFKDMSSGIVPVPLWIPQASMVLGLLILAIAFADELVNLVKGNPPSYQKTSSDILQSAGGE